MGANMGNHTNNVPNIASNFVIISLFPIEEVFLDLRFDFICWFVLLALLDSDRLEAVKGSIYAVFAAVVNP